MSSTLHDPGVAASQSAPETRPAPARRWVVVVLLLAAAAAAGAVLMVAVDSTPAAAPANTAAVATSLSDFAIDLGVDALESGATVTVDVVNGGQLPHDLAIVDGPATAVLSAGEAQSVTYQVGDAGSVRMVCTVPGHEAAGMFLTVPVSPAGS